MPSHHSQVVLHAGFHLGGAGGIHPPPHSHGWPPLGKEVPIFATVSEKMDHLAQYVVYSTGLKRCEGREAGTSQ